MAYPFNDSFDDSDPFEDRRRPRTILPAPALPNPPQAPPQGTFDRTRFRDEWMRQGGDPGGFVGGHQGDFGAGVEFLPDSRDKVRLPTGEVMDLSIDFGPGGANKPGWTGVGHQAQPGGAVQPYVQPGAPGSGSVTQQWQAAPIPQPAPVAAGRGGEFSFQSEERRRQEQDQELRRQLIAQLTQRAQQGLAIDRNDPAIRAQADAYAANEERARRNYLGDVAERAGPLANIRGEQRLAAERVGQRTGAFEAELVGRELTAKRNEIAQALESMRGMLNVGEEMTLRRELAGMDDAIRRMQLQQQAEQFGGELGFRYADLGQRGSQFGRTLAEQQRQFGSSLSLQQQQAIADMLDRGISPQAVLGYLQNSQFG